MRIQILIVFDDQGGGADQDVGPFPSDVRAFRQSPSNSASFMDAKWEEGCAESLCFWAD